MWLRTGIAVAPLAPPRWRVDVRYRYREVAGDRRLAVVGFVSIANLFQPLKVSIGYRAFLSLGRSGSH